MKPLTSKLLAVTAGTGLLIGLAAWILKSQQQPSAERRPPRPGTIPAMLENPEIQGDIRLILNSEFPLYESLDALTDASDAVVRGRVLLSRIYPCDQSRFLCTEFRFKVEEILAGSIPADRRGVDQIPSLKEAPNTAPADASQPLRRPVTEFTGPGPDEIVLTQPGGSLLMNGRRVIASVADQKMLQRLHQYILFLIWVPEHGKASAGWNTHHLAGGNQGVIELADQSAQSLYWDPSGPVRREVDLLLKNDRSLILSHFEQRRLGRRP